MILVHDIHGGKYRMLELQANGTLLECLRTGDRVKIGLTDWHLIGFIPPCELSI